MTAKEKAKDETKTLSINNDNINDNKISPKITIDSGNPQSKQEKYFELKKQLYSYGSYSYIAVAFGTVFYPFLRICLENKIIILKENFKAADISKLSWNLRQKGGYYCGFSSFIASKIFPLTVTSLLDASITEFLTAPIYLILSYPLYLNSNLRAYNLPGYASLMKYSDLIKLYSLKSNYKGFIYYIISSVLVYFPFINYTSHRFEAIRLAYVFGPYMGLNFKTYSEARNYLKNNKCFKYGRGYYNFCLHLINLFYMTSLIRVLGAKNTSGKDNKDKKPINKI